MTKLFFLFFIFCFFLTIIASALSVSPGELFFNSEARKENCQIITLSSFDGVETLIGEVNWLDNFDNLGVLSLYNVSTAEVPIDISYLQTIVNAEESIDVEICILSEEAGRYEGVIVYKTPPKRGQSLAVATWLRVNVTEAPPEPTPPTTTTNTGGGGGGGGGGSSSKPKTPPKNQTNQTNELEFLNTPNTQEQEQSGTNQTITGNVITENPDKSKYSTTIIVLIIIALASLIVHAKRR